jgi:glucose-6-phosphate isomerase
MPSLSQSVAWNALEKHFQEIKSHHMRDAFDSDPDRFNKFSTQFNDILFDFSKNRINSETLSLLIKLAKETGLKEKTEAMFSGEKINSTENRAVLHTALRNRSNKPVYVNGENVMPGVNHVLEKMRAFCDRIHSGEWLGYTGKPISDVVNIGIGGSDLGPKMVSTALTPYASLGIKVHFISNVDQTDLVQILNPLSPETTLFLVASKTFTTQETMINTNSARKWLMDEAKDESAIAKHFAATEGPATRAFGGSHWSRGFGSHLRLGLLRYHLGSDR